MFKFWRKPPERTPDKVELCAAEMWQAEDDEAQQNLILAKHLPELVEFDLIKHEKFCNRWLFDYAKKCIKSISGLNNAAYWPGKLYESEHVARRKEDALYLWYLFKDFSALKEFYRELDVDARCGLVRDALRFYPCAFREKDPDGNISLEDVIIADGSIEPIQAAFNTMMGSYSLSHPAVNSSPDRNAARRFAGSLEPHLAVQVLVNYLDGVRTELALLNNNELHEESIVAYCIKKHLGTDPLRNVFLDNYNPAAASVVFYEFIKLRPFDDTVKLVMLWSDTSGAASSVLTGLAIHTIRDFHRGNSLREFRLSPFYEEHRCEKKPDVAPLEIASYTTGFFIGAYIGYCQMLNDIEGQPSIPHTLDCSRLVSTTVPLAKRFTVFHILDYSPFLTRVFAAVITLASSDRADIKDRYVTNVFNGFIEYLEDTTPVDDSLSIESRLFLSFLGFDLKHHYSSLIKYFSSPLFYGANTDDAAKECADPKNGIDDATLYSEMLHLFFTWIIENRDIIEHLLPEDFKK